MELLNGVLGACFPTIKELCERLNSVIIQGEAGKENWQKTAKKQENILRFD